MAVDTLVTFTVSWSRGTDVAFTVNFDDSTADYNWAWDTNDHTTSYGPKTVSLTHTFTNIKNHTVTLDITNDVGSRQVEVLIVVEPILDDVLNAFVSYVPKAVPTVVEFVLRPETTLPLESFNVWCELDYDLLSDDANSTFFGIVTSTTEFIYSYEYTTDSINSTYFLECRNHISIFTNTSVIRLQTNFSLATLTYNTSAVATGDTVFLGLRIFNGSHADINVAFGDGISEILPSFNHILNYVDTITLEYTYTAPGEYTASAVLSNFYYETTVTSDDLIRVQNPVVNLALDVPTLVGVPPGDAAISITPDPNPGALLPSVVSCQWNLSADVNVDEFSTLITSGNAESKSISFQRVDVGSSHTVNVTCYNLVSRQDMTASLSIQEVISGLTITPQTTFIQRGGFVTFDITASTGSHVRNEIESNDGESFSVNSTTLFAADETLTGDLYYYNVGNFTASLTAVNDVSEETVDADEHVTVRNAILNVEMVSNFSVLWPPGIVEYAITSMPGQLDLTHMFCMFDFGQQHTSSMYISELAAGDTFVYSHTFPRSHLGNITGNVTCDNKVSEMNMSSTTWIILDEVILSTLTTNDSVLLTNTSYFSLTVERFGKKSCFQFIMGDGSTDTVYGSDEMCQQHASDNNLDYVPIEYGELALEHEYIYDYFAHFNMSVFAFNHVSNDTLYVDAWVKDWPCYWPNITMPENVSDDAAPLVKMKSSEFVITPDTLIDCMKTGVTDTSWEVFGANDMSSVVMGLTDEDSFQYSPLSLDYGPYILVYNVSMHQVDNRWNISEAFISIVPTPLQMNDTFQDVHHELQYNTTLEINALAATMDLDVEAGNKIGITCTLQCRQTDETYPTPLESVATNVESIATTGDEWQDGCFGTGPGTHRSFTIY